MTVPRFSIRPANADNANDLSRLFASLMPRNGEDVGAFLFDAALALGMREAELASLLGVSRSTLSGWKSRGSIPATYNRWFKEEFVYLLFSRGFQGQHVEDLRHIGIRIALRVLRSTDFDPFGCEGLDQDERLNQCFWFFQAICQFGHFVLKRLALDEVKVAERERAAAERVVSMLRALGPRLFADR